MIWVIRLYFSSEGRCAADFYYPYKSITMAGLEPTNYGFNGKHPNHYITKATVSSYAGFMLRRVLQLKFKGNRLVE
jgi:hypothetical protein